MVTALGYGIWGNMNQCSWAIVTHIWLYICVLRPTAFYKNAPYSIIIFFI